MSDSPRFDVAIVGFGPSGAVLANLLGQAGVSVVVLEKESGIYPMPRAIHFDGEVMRVFQNTGLLQEVLAIARPGAHGMHFVNAQGQTMMIRRGSDQPGLHGFSNSYYFHQPELEAVLRHGAKRFSNVDIRLQREVVKVVDSSSCATLTVRNVADDTLQTIQADFVIGSDGARSLVRKTIGASMIDLGLHQPWLVFDVILKTDVDLPAYTVQFCNPIRPMTYCNVVGQRRRWEIMVMPDDDPVAIVQPANLWSMVSQWVKPEQADIERAVIYTFHSVIADRWRKGRLLLAGDAAHQTPPFLGQGMCAGVRDAANLAWKLVSVIRGRADDDLLNTYETERSPHVRAFIDLAVHLGDIIQTTDPHKAHERDSRFSKGQPEIFEFPAPRLDLGDTGGDNTLVGRPFPQPILDNGQLMDDVVGNRIAIIGRADIVKHVSPDTYNRWQHAEAIVIDQPDTLLANWLDDNNIQAVMVRPDHYIMGVAKTAHELNRLSQCLPVAPNG